MIDTLVPPLMGYEDTIEYLLVELLKISDAAKVSIVNGEGFERCFTSPKSQRSLPAEIFGDLAIPLANVAETINIFNTRMTITSDEITAISNICGRSLENALKYQSMRQKICIDELTGLINKHTLKKRIDEVIAHCERVGGRFSIAFIDLDHFKAINDTYGHLKGDAVLVEIAALLQESFRQSNVIARFGGDEFIILFKDATRNFEHVLCQRILRIMQKIEILDFPISASIGFSYYPEDGCKFENLISRADSKMYLFEQQIKQCITR